MMTSLNLKLVTSALDLVGNKLKKIKIIISMSIIARSSTSHQMLRVKKLKKLSHDSLASSLSDKSDSSHAKNTESRSEVQLQLIDRLKRVE